MAKSRLLTIFFNSKWIIHKKFIPGQTGNTDSWVFLIVYDPWLFEFNPKIGNKEYGLCYTTVQKKDSQKQDRTWFLGQKYLGLDHSFPIFILWLLQLCYSWNRNWWWKHFNMVSFDCDFTGNSIEQVSGVIQKFYNCFQYWINSYFRQSKLNINNVLYFIFCKSPFLLDRLCILCVEYTIYRS